MRGINIITWLVLFVQAMQCEGKWGPSSHAWDPSTHDMPLKGIRPEYFKWQQAVRKGAVLGNYTDPTAKKPRNIKWPNQFHVFSYHGRRLVMKSARTLCDTYTHLSQQFPWQILTEHECLGMGTNFMNISCCMWDPTETNPTTQCKPNPALLDPREWCIPGYVEGSMKPRKNGKRIESKSKYAPKLPKTLGKKGKGPKLYETALHVDSIRTLMLVGLIVGSGVAVAAFRLRKRTPAICEESLL